MALTDTIAQVEHETATVAESAAMEPVEGTYLQNTAFSRQQPFLQQAWDSTSLGALKTCPKYYYYTMILGLSPRGETSVHLRFGLEFHAALELYDRLRAENVTHEPALLTTVKSVLVRTWNTALARPWTSDDPTKTRETLVRAVVWYLDQFENDPLETVILANGQPAVELSFRFDSGVESSTGEPFLLCGHLDKIAKFNGRPFIVDRKTTRGAIGEEYFTKYSPDNQMSLYDVGGQVIYPEPIAGLIIDAGQTGVTYTRFQRGFVIRTEAQREEWLADFRVWMQIAESFAQARHWPQNEKACLAYSSYSEDHATWMRGCPFRPVCGATPEVRPALIKQLYDRRVWNPLQTREI